MSKKYADVVPFKVEHLDLMELRDIEAALLEENPTKYDALAKLGFGGTMMYDGRILCAFGILENWSGNYEVWVIPTIFAPKYPRQFLRTIKGKLEAVARTFDVKRFQSPAIADEHHDKWMRHFGFVNETPNGMPNYGANGETFNMWGLTYDRR